MANEGYIAVIIEKLNRGGIHVVTNSNGQWGLRKPDGTFYHPKGCFTFEHVVEQAAIEFNLDHDPIGVVTKSAAELHVTGVLIFVKCTRPLTKEIIDKLYTEFSKPANMLELLTIEQRTGSSSLIKVMVPTSTHSEQLNVHETMMRIKRIIYNWWY